MPLPAIATYRNNHTATQVNHQSGLVAATISFNLPPGGSLSKAGATIDKVMHDLGGSRLHSRQFCRGRSGVRPSMSTMPLLILAALVAVYIVLGVLYRTPCTRSPSCPHYLLPASAQPWPAHILALRFQ